MTPRQTLSLVRRVDNLSDDQVANSIAILELQPRMTAAEDRVESLAQDVKHVQDVLDVAETKVVELRYRVDAYSREQVDAFRVEVDGLHKSTKVMSQRVQTLKTALQEAKAEIHDLWTCLSTSKSSERCMITYLLRIEVRISALKQRPPRPQGSSSDSS
uniref:Uncharacterized protein n=1 Tax=Tanacetum cinerariifolium TaxID=118510 RepID=A0A6L2J996_TANCI|nr:hypothetical protein [Tanacetum cinerariifolium]